jgi:hypothetical protein
MTLTTEEDVGGFDGGTARSVEAGPAVRTDAHHRDCHRLRVVPGALRPLPPG